MIYVCIPCDAYVGVHKGTDKALGRLADLELRHWKKEAHSHFDPIWKTGLLPRAGAYVWLSNKMNLHIDLTHIGMMDVEQCKKVIELCNELKGK